MEKLKDAFSSNDTLDDKFKVAEISRMPQENTLLNTKEMEQGSTMFGASQRDFYEIADEISEDVIVKFSAPETEDSFGDLDIYRITFEDEKDDSDD